MSNDREILRALAARVREIADYTEMSELKSQWIDLNGLRSKKPMVLVYPEGAWREIQPATSLECSDPLLRGWENDLRQRIYTYEKLRSDQVIEPNFNIGWQMNYSDYGVPMGVEHSGADQGAYAIKAPITNLDSDLDKLHFRELSVDREATYQRVKLAEDLFGDLLTVRIHGCHFWTLGLTWEIIRLIGLENLMMYMYDNPEGLHRLMQFMHDEHAHFVDWHEREGLLSRYQRYIGSGGMGYTDELPSGEPAPGESVTCKEMWILGESQETVGVSPAMFHEFIFPYQKTLIEKFGLSYYGCCEGVHERLDDLFTLNNLRGLSVAPWADQKILAARAGRDYVLWRKPNPTMVCVNFHEQEIRDDIRNTLDLMGDLNLAIVMKDVHTVQNNPERLGRWVEIVREEIQNAS